MHTCTLHARHLVLVAWRRVVVEQVVDQFLATVQETTTRRQDTRIKRPQILKALRMI